jgi:hypothetical protein
MTDRDPPLHFALFLIRIRYRCFCVKILDRLFCRWDPAPFSLSGEAGQEPFP